MRNTSIRIIEQGDVRINGATIVVDSAKVVAVEIDFATKYVELCHDFGDKLVFSPEKFNKTTNFTVITLPEFTGWKVFCSESLRYTCRLCLIKE